MKGDADETQQGKVGQVFPAGQDELLAPVHGAAEDDHADQEAQPHYADGGKLAQGDFGGDE